MTIRKATKKDIEEIAELHWYLISHLAEVHPRRYNLLHKTKIIKLFKEKLIKTMKDNKKSIVIVSEDENINGFGLGRIKEEPLFVNFKDYGEIDEIVITKENQGNGLSKKVLGEILKFFRQNKIKRAELLVDSKNEIALKAWKKRGFTEQLKIMGRRL